MTALDHSDKIMRAAQGETPLVAEPTRGVNMGAGDVTRTQKERARDRLAIYRCSMMMLWVDRDSPPQIVPALKSKQRRSAPSTVSMLDVARRIKGCQAVMLRRNLPRPAPGSLIAPPPP